MEEQLEEMDQLLYSWNLPQLCAIFREQEMTPEALDALTDTDIETLIPKLGPRALFRKRLHEWLQTPQDSSINVQQQPVQPRQQQQQEQSQIIESLVDDEQQMALSYVDDDENEVEMLNEVWLNDELNVEDEQVDSTDNRDREISADDIAEITENVFMEEQKPNISKLVIPLNNRKQQKTGTERPKRIEIGTRHVIFDKDPSIKKTKEFKQEPTQNKTTKKQVGKELKETEKQKASEEISVSSSIERCTPNTASTQRRNQRIGHNWASLNVQELLLSSADGRSLIENYEANPILDKRARYYIADIIVTESFAKNLIMDRHKFDDIVNQIVELFPTEEKETWYVAQKSSKKNSGGTLYYKYYATYTKMRKNGFYQHYSDSVKKHLDSEASLSAAIEHSNCAVKLQDIDDEDAYKVAFRRSIPRYERIRKSSDFQRINVKEVLERTYEGLGIIDFYEKNSTLDVTTRNRLAKIVCTEGINRNIKMQPSDFYDISCQVVELFPNERHEVYFFPRGKTPPKGCLYHKYIYLIRRMKKMGIVKHEAD